MKKITIFLAALLAACVCASAQNVYEEPEFHPKAPAVPTKAVFAGQKVDLTDPDRYERMDRELMTFTYMHSTSSLMLKRAPKYFPIVEPILRQYGIPDDLKYLMVIESNLDPKALSTAGAAGLWQFTKATAKEYGLEIREGVDERYNIEKETIAACKFLKKAYAKFGDWMTVAASYNAGQGGIAKRIEQQHQSCGLDLWTPEETARYMYRLLAVKMMFESPADFGFRISDSEKYPYREPKDVVTVGTSIESLVDFAEEYGTTYAKLKAANLWLRDIKLDNPAGKNYQIIIP